MAIKLTDTVVRSLEAPATGSKITYDTDITGFGARITAKGVIAFILNYRNADGVEHRHTLGKYPAWSVSAARDEAKLLRQDIDRGADPVAAKREQRGAPTVHDLIERFREEHLPKKAPVTQANYKGALAEIDREIGKLKVASVEYRNVERLHAAITKRGPVQANRTLAVLVKMFALAVKWRWRPDNPCKGIERNHETPRERYLTADELRRLLAALDTYHHRAAADLFLFLLLTGARVGETFRATWSQINDGVWTKPSHHTKTKKIHAVPLSAPAQQLLARIRAGQDSSETRVFAIKRRSLLNKDWLRICRVAKLEDFHIHDLRHAHASMLINAGYSLPVVGKMLGHTQPATTHRYAHLVPDTLAEAASAVGKIVAGAKVLPLRRGRR
jgi:integrase